MKSLRFLTIFACATAMAATPALAVTANGGSVNSRARVTLDASSITNTDADSGPGAPASLSSSANAGQLDEASDTIVSAFSNTNATWASATQGSVSMAWGWDARNGGETDTAVSTVLAGSRDWTYDFTTGAESGSFNANWTLVVGGSTGSFGLQGVYGDGSTPFNVSPSTVSPISGSGSFSVLLAPNTAYSFSIWNNGNLSSATSGLNSETNGLFTMDWNIETRNGVIPEPQSWAMMIAGFGLVGAAMRRRPERRPRATA
jgi:hypothetical protein